MSKSNTVSTPPSLTLLLGTYVKSVDAELDRVLPKITLTPSLIHESMRYSIFAGGKRIRPILCLMTAEMLSGNASKIALTQACAIEMIHTYSLIHDDLPAMDNDDLRRGKPTNHKKFDEATAILAGDALLTFAFEHMSAEIKNPAIALNSINCLSQAIGTKGMIGGQVMDMQGEKNSTPTIDDVNQIHQRKTGALLQASMVLGAIATGADAKTIKIIQEVGAKLGCAFQIADDILDLESSPEKLGKSVKKDIKVNKITYPRVLGIEKSKQKAKELIGEVHQLLLPFGEKADSLKSLANYIIDRNN